MRRKRGENKTGVSFNRKKGWGERRMRRIID
jgi:hypothetical protein